jgi:hypothetical protein
LPSTELDFCFPCVLIETEQGGRNKRGDSRESVGTRCWVCTLYNGFIIRSCRCTWTQMTSGVLSDLQVCYRFWIISVYICVCSPGSFLHRIRWIHGVDVLVYFWGWLSNLLDHRLYVWDHPPCLLLFICNMYGRTGMFLLFVLTIGTVPIA